MGKNKNKWSQSETLFASSGVIAFIAIQSQPQAVNSLVSLALAGVAVYVGVNLLLSKKHKGAGVALLVFVALLTIGFDLGGLVGWLIEVFRG